MNSPIPTGNSSAPEITDSAGFIKCLWVAAGFATLLKLICAARTLGTVDVASQFHFGKMINTQSMEWLYTNDRLFNHMPLVGLFSSLVYSYTHGNPRLFAFFFRIPNIAADLAALHALISVLPLQKRITRWALLLFALSPVSFMVSGFNGNVDPLMACCLLFAATACVRNRPLQSAFFYALACNVKTPALLMAPVFFFFWLGRKQGGRFALATAAFTLAGWAYPLVICPHAFLRNVLGYGSFWGIWGITYWLWLTGWKPFHTIIFYDFSPWQNFVMNLLKTGIIGGTFWIAWRRRNASGAGIFQTVSAVWIVFMAFSPSVAGQYLVWPLAFLLAAQPRWFFWITAASTMHLAVYYTVLCGGFPWYIGIAKHATNPIWMASSNIAWAAYLICFARTLMQPTSG